MGDLSKHLGNRIRELRKLQNMSQEELALKSNINPAHLGQIERGFKSPTLDTLEKIIHALNIQAADLFSEYISDDTTKASIYISSMNNLMSSMTARQQEIVLNTINNLIQFSDGSKDNV